MLVLVPPTGSCEPLKDSVPGASSTLPMPMPMPMA
jgi:hypothetical protein